MPHGCWVSRGSNHATVKTHGGVDMAGWTCYRCPLCKPQQPASTKRPSNSSSAITGRYSGNARVPEVVEKMLGCGDPASGYSTYLCEHCLEEKRVAFSCKRSFCLSCCKVSIDQWVRHIGQTLYEGVSYRHVVFTVPDVLRMPFFYDRSLLADLRQCGVKMLGDALSWFKKCPL